MESDASSADDVSDATSQEVTVTSEVNHFLVLETQRQPLQSSNNVIAKLQFTLPAAMQRQNQIAGTASASLSANESSSFTVDSDGDLEVPRSRHQANSSMTLGRESEEFIFIEYVNSTTLELVGHQIWRGAFLLSDFILKNAEAYFRGKTVLELGSGTGFSSVVASLIASKVITTDLDDRGILELIQANFKHNETLIQSEVVVKALDFLNITWTRDLENLVAEAEVIIAADVVYHDRITEGFVLTLQKCLSTGVPKTVFIALEKRYVFTLSDLDVVAPVYDHFLTKLESVLGIYPREVKGQQPENTSQSSGQTHHAQRLQIENVDLSVFPVHFNYEPSNDLVLWKITTT